MKQTAYILEKDGIYYSFPSQKAVCEFFHAEQSTISYAANNNGMFQGYRIIKAIAEEEIYFNKRLHKIWSSMHERCEYEKHPYFQHYGGRGISVCNEWNEYLPFAKWAFSHGYNEILTLDRINNNGNYEPDNCRWVTMKAQQNNKRNNRIIIYDGKEFTLTELAELIGMNKTTLKERLNMGWSVEDAVDRPIRLRTKGWRMSRCGAKMEE